MNPAEFRAWIARLGLTRAQAAEVLGVRVRHVYRWLDGSTPLKRSTVLACEHIAQEFAAQEETIDEELCAQIGEHAHG